MNTTVVTPPVGSVCAPDLARAYLRLGSTGEDTLVESLIAAATARVEAATGLALLSRTLRLTLYGQDWAGGLIRLRPGPVTRLVGVEAVDAAGEVRGLSDAFTLEPGRPAIVCAKPGVMPLGLGPGERLEVTFEAGFGGPEDVPDDLVLGVKRLAAFLYDARGTDGSGLEGSLPRSLGELLAPWTEVRL